MICDSPAGIENGAVMAMRYADMAIVVTNPEVSSVRDSDRIIGLLDSKTRMRRERRAHREATAADTLRPGRAARGEMLNVEDVLEILSIPLLGIIPGERGDSAGLQSRFPGDDLTARRAPPAVPIATRQAASPARACDRNAGREEDSLGRLFGRKVA